MATLQKVFLLALLLGFVGSAEGVPCHSVNGMKDFVVDAYHRHAWVYVECEGVCDCEFTHIVFPFQVDPPEAEVTVTAQGWWPDPIEGRWWELGYHNPAEGKYLYYAGRGYPSREVYSDDPEVRPSVIVLFMEFDRDVTLRIATQEEAPNAGIWNWNLNVNQWSGFSGGDEYSIPPASRIPLAIEPINKVNSTDNDSDWLPRFSGQ